MTKRKHPAGRSKAWSLTPAGWHLAIHGDPPSPEGGLKLALRAVARVARARNCLRYLRGELDDLAMDAAVIAAARHDPGRGAFSTMVFAVARSVLNWRLAYAAAWKRARRTARLDDARPPAVHHAGYGEVEARDAAARVLRVLPPRYREALYLRHGLEWSLADAGRALGVATERARQLVDLAMDRLKESGVKYLDRTPRTLLRKGIRTQHGAQCTVPRGEPEPEADEALLARCRQLAHDLANLGGDAPLTKLSAGLAVSLCEARPQWFTLLVHKGRPWGVVLTPAGRAALIGGG